MPLPATRVFPPNWSQAHRPTATDTMTGCCTITRGGTAVYEGPCRIIADGTNETEMVGDRKLLTVRYLVTVRYDTNDVRVGDVVTVIDAVDGGLVGRTLTVKEVRYGTQQWERDLYADDEAAGLPVLSEPVTIVRAPLVTGYGNSLLWDWDNASRTTVLGALTPGSSSEQTGARDEVTTFYRCVLPAGTDVRVTDRVEALGRTWEVDGEPQPWPSPETGTAHHVELTLRIDLGG
ncbi:DUF6093 family protein [Actinomadura sp. LOL_016]|uniref:DUF6093 family protein n=1 Tax=unclassified Actinomadura TaxID=2626254 RepID=UPI003A7FC9B7